MTSAQGLGCAMDRLLMAGGWLTLTVLLASTAVQPAASVMVSVAWMFPA